MKKKNNLVKFFCFAILRNPLPNKYIIDDLDNEYVGKRSFTVCMQCCSDRLYIMRIMVKQ